MELKIYPDDPTLSTEQMTKNYDAFKREALGAIVYTIMAIMYKEYTLVNAIKNR